MADFDLEVTISLGKGEWVMFFVEGFVGGGRF